jgi:hypothetical protein
MNESDQPSLTGIERDRADEFSIDCSHFAKLIAEVRKDLVHPGASVFRSERLAKVAENVINEELSAWPPTSKH